MSQSSYIESQFTDFLSPNFGKINPKLDDNKDQFKTQYIKYITELYSDITWGTTLDKHLDYKEWINEYK